jgi:uncharacterized membrane protein
MSQQVIPARDEVFPSNAAAAGRVVLGALAGAAGGLAAGAAGFESLVAAFLGMLAGAVGGILAAAKSLEKT